MNKKHHHEHHHKPKKKKLSPFYKVTFSFLIIGFVALFYFLVLVTTTPKSFSFVTNEIVDILQKKFGENNVGVENSYLSFTRYGTLKIAVTSLKILYSNSDKTDKQVFVIPRLETEFSLLNFLFLRFQPTKIKMINPNIIINDLSKISSTPSEDILSEQHDLSLMIELLSSIRKGDNPIENFEIENAKLTFHSATFKTEVLLKKSQISASIKGGALNISSQNQLTFDASKSDVNLGSSCKLSKKDGLKCDLFLTNFIPDSISALHPKLSHLSKIAASFDANISFVAKDRELKNVTFKIKTEKGSFEFLDFFGHRMNFSNFAASGEYDSKLKILDLSQIETDFASDMAEERAVAKPHLSMSLLVSDLEKTENKLDFYIKLQNVLNDELEKFWPASLEANGSRAWVTEHIKGGLIKNAYAKFSMLLDEKESHLTSMDSEIVFADLNIAYSSDFPEITNVAGIANFSNNDMKIAIYSGNVLGSRLYDGLVAIDDFSAKKVMLKLSGKLQGKAGDGLKHANNSPEFFAGVEKYLNGNSQSDFDVRVSLSNKITLKNSYIAVDSAITGLDNGYVRGGVIIHAKKDFNSTNFVSNIDLTAAEIVAEAFDITKKPLVESEFNFVVATKDPKKIYIRNISLWKKEEMDSKNSKQKTPQFEVTKLSGSLAFETSPFALSYLNLTNNGFGKNDYSLSYALDSAKSVEKIFLKGKRFNFGSFIEHKFFAGSSGNSVSSQIQISLDRVDLLRNKFLRSFYLSMNCYNNLCYKGMAKAAYGKQKFISFRASKLAKNDFSTIDGRISDVGYLAEGFGISNVVSDGDAKLNLKNKLINAKPALEGEITIDNSITIHETETVKRLSKNDLFSKIKDKIFSSEKTTFDSLKLEFTLQGSALTINSLIANNYKIGITSKGVIDLENNAYQLKGMIVPGFIVNNLFGIGKIPLIGGVISGILTGGEGGGLFGIRYEYVKKKDQKDGDFTTDKVTAFVPSTIQNLFD